MIMIVNTVNTNNKIDSFTLTNEITIDGKWTNSEEWNDTIEEVLFFGKGSGEAYLHVKHDSEYLYVLVDFITYKDTKTGDGCLIVLDTKNDGGLSIQSDDSQADAR